MSLWTEDEFQRVALQTRLGDSTKAACRLVLVEGAQGSKAATDLKIFQPQLSRGLKLLKEKQSEILENSQAMQSGEALGKLTAIQVARNLLGVGLGVEDAVPGGKYEGPVMVNTHGFLIQKVGRTGIAHDLGKLEKMPPLNVPISINYAVGQERASVGEPMTEKAPGKGVGR